MKNISKKAKSIKSVPTKSKRLPVLSRSSLVALASATSFSVDIAIDFFSGLGQATVVLFRNGLLINMQSISITESIHFTDVESRDTIAVNGVCSGKAKVTISVPTNPTTSEDFIKIIIGGYTIL